MGNKIYAIKDLHSDSGGRKKAKELLTKKKVNVYFIEWAKPINIDNIDEDKTFEGLAKSDAEPSLKDLAKTALKNDIHVIHCDLTVEETVKRLNSRDKKIDKYAGTYKDLSAFQPWGKGIRDKHAAEVIANYMNSKKECSGLVMFGADHFKAEDDRGADPLHELIKNETGITCEFI